MKQKRIIQLINDERTLLSVSKVQACDSTARDDGCDKGDYAHCATHAWDTLCPIDQAACIDGAHDYCDGEKDLFACSGSSAIDF